MKKTQIQIPDHLYEQAKAIARERELSFAEVVRRGIEYIVGVYMRIDPDKEWSLPQLPAERFRKESDDLDLKSVIEDAQLEGRVGDQSQERN